MAKVFEEEGGKLRLGCEVRKIRYQGRCASSVELTSGESIPCDDLIVNADYAHARTLIFGERNVARKEMLKKKFSCSTFMLYLGLDKIYQDEPHHHIIFADDYHRNVSDIQGEREVSGDASVYVRNSSVNDKTVAPAGHSQLYVLVPTINRRNGHDWEESREAYRDKVLDRIIEDRAHGVGRALWRDIESAARLAARPDAPHRHLVENLARQVESQPGFRLRIFTESEGAIALSRLVNALMTSSTMEWDDGDAFFEMLDSVDIVAPPMTMDQFADLARALDVGWGPERPDRKVRLHLASASDERRLAVPPYGQSYPELVLRSFQARGRDPGGDARNLTAARATKLGARRVEVHTLDWPKGGRPKPRTSINQRQLIYDTDVGARLRAALKLAPHE